MKTVKIDGVKGVADTTFDLEIPDQFVVEPISTVKLPNDFVAHIYEEEVILSWWPGMLPVVPQQQTKVDAKDYRISVKYGGADENIKEYLKKFNPGFMGNVVKRASRVSDYLIFTANNIVSWQHRRAEDAKLKAQEKRQTKPLSRAR